MNHMHNSSTKQFHLFQSKDNIWEKDGEILEFIPEFQHIVAVLGVEDLHVWSEAAIPTRKHCFSAREHNPEISQCAN